MQPELFTDPAAAIADLLPGATVMIGGQGGAGVPTQLLQALADHRRHLTLICDANASEVLQLISQGQVDRLVCPPLSLPAWQLMASGMTPYIRLVNVPDPGGYSYPTGMEIEIHPAGVLTERIRAAGAGIGAFLTLPHPDPQMDVGKERQVVDGRQYVVEVPIRADFALLKARTADTLGNLVYQGTARNWNPGMATAAATVIVEVEQVVEPGDIDPETVVTPGIFVDRIVAAEAIARLAGGPSS